MFEITTRNDSTPIELYSEEYDAIEEDVSVLFLLRSEDNFCCISKKGSYFNLYKVFLLIVWDSEFKAPSIN